MVDSQTLTNNLLLAAFLGITFLIGFLKFRFGGYVVWGLSNFNRKSLASQQIFECFVCIQTSNTKKVFWHQTMEDKVTTSFPSENCPICLEKMAEKSTFRIFQPCQHNFCNDCSETLNEKYDYTTFNCPLCRKIINKQVSQLV